MARIRPLPKGSVASLKVQPALCGHIVPKIGSISAHSRWYVTGPRAARGTSSFSVGSPPILGYPREGRASEVNIRDTVYVPTQVPAILEEMLEIIMNKARYIKNPIEAAFFLWVNLGLSAAVRGWQQAH